MESMSGTIKDLICSFSRGSIGTLEDHHFFKCFYFSFELASKKSPKRREVRVVAKKEKETLS